MEDKDKQAERIGTHISAIAIAEKKRDEGNYEDAIRYYNKELERNKTSIEAWIGKGISEHNLGNKEAAIRSYKKSIIIDPEIAGGYYYLGLVLSQYSDGKKSIKAFRESIYWNDKYQWRTITYVQNYQITKKERSNGNY